ncbi:hypothetical protein E8E13_010303 [Curvularia kusanoi]|uniref:Uncharacterized protein n=1 Tax=Curvularia kusanoi TaxID=90978 RepID=A0A9P4WDC0_CURKU|nr:hypothetical protein E8E13_010303 [Curvularia kusanoi]
MATISRNFLEVDDPHPSGKKQRSRSSGHVDRMEEEERIERRQRDLRMKEYHDSTRRTSTVHHRTKSDHLDVPIWETNRRPRSGEESGQTLNEPPRAYRVEEIKPSTRVYDYDLNPEPTNSGQLQVPFREKAPRPDKTRAKVPPIIIQKMPASSNGGTSPGLSPNKSPSASPHSPTARPVLQVQYEKLQDTLTQTSGSCKKYLDVEPANPQDLTFTKIQETVEGFAEDLHVWSHVANLNGLARIDRNLRHLVDAASDVLGRLLVRAADLREACANAKPKDLKMPVLDDGDDDDLYEDGKDSADQDPTQMPGFMIQSLLDSIRIQIRQLKLLSTSLQEATPDVGIEMVNVARLVEEAGKFFGSEATMKKYSVYPKYAGKKAFVEARFVADTLS